MPLEPGSTRAAVSHNVETEMHAGKPQPQAVAIALKKAGLSNQDSVPVHDAPPCNLPEVVTGTPMRRF